MGSLQVLLDARICFASCDRDVGRNRYRTTCAEEACAGKPISTGVDIRLERLDCSLVDSAFADESADLVNIVS